VGFTGRGLLWSGKVVSFFLLICDGLMLALAISIRSCLDLELGKVDEDLLEVRSCQREIKDNISVEEGH
jgi:hypothetical protein